MGLGQFILALIFLNPRFTEQIYLVPYLEIFNTSQSIALEFYQRMVQ